MKCKTLIVGLGSAHGDDQVGWRVAESLATRANDVRASVRVARSPAELLGWLDGVERLIVCDACQNLGSPGTVHHWRWPHVPAESLRSSGSHDLGLAAVLTLADELHALPAELTVWGVEMSSCSPGSPLSPCVQAAVPRIVETIIREIATLIQVP